VGNSKKQGQHIGIRLIYGATDEVNFTALPGGRWDYSNDKFDDIGGLGYFWSSTESTDDSYTLFLEHTYTFVVNTPLKKDYYFSVRCLKD